MRGSQEAARNITTFLTWARTLGLEDPDAFQLNDLLKYVLFVVVVRMKAIDQAVFTVTRTPGVFSLGCMT